MKNKHTRESRGVAFVLFLKEESAKKCVELYNGTQVKFLSVETKLSTLIGLIPHPSIIG